MASAADFSLRKRLAFVWSAGYVSLPVPKVNGFFFGDGECPPGREAGVVSLAKDLEKVAKAT